MAWSAKLSWKWKSLGLGKLLANLDDPNKLKGVFKVWVGMYSSATLNRFREFARGNGNWMDLALATKVARARKKKAKQLRRKDGATHQPPPMRILSDDEISPDDLGKKKRVRVPKTLLTEGQRKKQQQQEASIAGRSFAILIDTGIMQKGLAVGAQGNYTALLKDGFRFGFAPTPHEGSQKTVQEIAAIHDEGGKDDRPPQREILVYPSPKLVDRMFGVLRSWLEANTK